MTAAPLISVIVPVYNCASLLEKCIGSILAQDYRNFELLLVDDGSTDGSADVCRSFDDPRLRVLSKPNGGPAMARNFGLDHCSAEAGMVCFVDADDYVGPGYLSGLLATGGDLAVNTLVHHNIDGTEEEMELSETLFTDFWDNADFIRALRGGIMNPPCGKLYSLPIIRAANLRFDNVRLLEDVSFNFNYLRHCRSVGMAPRPNYHYIHRPGSETSRADAESAANYEVFHMQLRSLFSPRLAAEVDRLLYPQYMALILRFIRKSDSRSARRLLRRPMVRKSFSAHRCTSAGEAVVKKLLQFGLLSLAKPFI